MRLFVAFPAPPLTNFFPLVLKGATRVETGDLHLTLCFIGDTPRNIGYDIVDELTRVAFTPFEITLYRYGVIGGEKPHSLHLLAQKTPALMQFQQKIEQLLLKLGLPLEAREFTPHVTLGLLRKADASEVAAFIAAQPLFNPVSFTPLCFNLYASKDLGTKSLLGDTPYAIVSSHASQNTAPSC